MAGLIKELLLDLGINHLSVDLRTDLNATIQSLQCAGVITDSELKMLDLYVSGYTAQEIAYMQYVTTDVVEAVLIRIVRAIETASGYTDDIILQKVERDKKQYPRSKIPVLERYLHDHGTDFSTHV